MFDGVEVKVFSVDEELIEGWVFGFVIGGLGVEEVCEFLVDWVEMYVLWVGVWYGEVCIVGKRVGFGFIVCDLCVVVVFFVVVVIV